MLTPDQISAIAKQRGDTVVNPPPADGVNRAQELQSAWNTPEAPKEPGFFSKVGNFLGGIGESVAPLGVGVLKSGLNTLQGASTIGQKLGQATGLMPKQPTIELPKSLTEAQGTLETIGKTAGDIAQFFIPGRAETAAAGKLGEVLDTAKLAEKYGPEAAKTIKGLWDALSTGLATGASTQAVSELQTGGQAGAGYGVAGFLGGAAGKALETFGPGLARAIEKANFKLTPTQEAKLAPKIEAASSFVADNKISGSETAKFRKLNDINNKLEDAMQASVGKDVSVGKADLIKEIQNAPEALKTTDPAVYPSAKADANQAVKTLQETQGDKITLNDLLNGKRSYGKSAFGKASAQVKGSTVLSEGDYAIEQAYQNVLEKGMSDTGKSVNIPKSLQQYFGGKTEATLPEFNKVYSDAINAKKFTNAAQFKRDTGLVGRLFGLWAGEAVGSAIAPGLGGKIVGGALGEIASSRVPGLLRNVAQRAVSTPEFAPGAVKTIEGMTTSPDQTTSP